jgi:hypothetical protein
MSRSLIVMLAILAIAYPAGIWFPWWVIAPTAALVSFLSGLGQGRAFLIAFLAGLLLWGGLAFYMDLQNEGILSQQIGVLFQGLPSIALTLISAVLGACTAGLGGWSGAALRQALTPAS